jgi:uncharacterized membrane protein
MKSKQQVAEILSFISLIICIIEMSLFFLLCDYGYPDLPKEDILFGAPFILALALILSIISLFFNKRQLLSWGILIFVISLFPVSIFLMMQDYFRGIKF